MIIRNLDENHDWTFGHGLNNYLSGQPAVGLNIDTRLLSWVGDCFFDLQACIDWKNRLGNKNQRALLELDLKRVILTSFGVTGITSFGTTLNVRDFFAQYDVSSIFSQSYQNSIKQGVGNV